MNTFASLLLAFPFYLALNGKLAAYVALAKPSAVSNTTGEGVASATTAGENPVKAGSSEATNANTASTAKASTFLDNVQGIAAITGMFT